ncbi:aminoacyl tRNA synthase complex-interacting multifunctional protein 2 isoform X2 [Anthonomus grandis grandis]|uniref:aminoacyl tRNA synthase complex-interacting multifunctional protein 2 isoform X2 n=1 Tax=Anthonomus grandis grandis TaxID=2921223 RepID=UPI0021657A8A|nr:aminoacyl tRNA synthase complex-interacting multifunctional protein 2 isoform X2 [Anthonomus grandis grandis]
MRSPIKMYYLKPIVVHDFTVEIPKCMYKLSNIHGPRKLDGSEEHVTTPARKLDITEKNCQEVPGMAELEARQGAILDQLAELRRRISGLKKELNLQVDSTPQENTPLSSSTVTTTQKNSLPGTLVIGVSPTNPPYSLELLQKLLQDQIGLAVTCYLHSSVPSLPKDAAQLQEALTNFKPKDGVHVVNLRLIWKNLSSSNAEFLLTRTPIQGEVNLLRYLCRATNTTLSYDNDTNLLEIDSILDQCHLLALFTTKTERAAIFRTLNKSTNKSSWLAGKSDVGVADLAAYSAIKQSNSASELNASLAKWYQRCASL